MSYQQERKPKDAASNAGLAPICQQLHFDPVGLNSSHGEGGTPSAEYSRTNKSLLLLEVTGILLDQSR